MRLTERKVCYPQCDKQGNLTRVGYIKIEDKKLAEEKLCQLEDIEEELGIDLLTLIKANNDGAYFKEDLRHYIANVDLKHKCVRLIKHYEAEDDFDCHYVIFKDYGKTWALTREELL